MSPKDYSVVPLVAAMESPLPEGTRSRVYRLAQVWFDGRKNEAHGLGSSHCISWYQIQLSLTTCHVRYHIALWGSRSIGQL